MEQREPRELWLFALEALVSAEIPLLTISSYSIILPTESASYAREGLKSKGVSTVRPGSEYGAGSLAFTRTSRLMNPILFDRWNMEKEGSSAFASSP